MARRKTDGRRKKSSGSVETSGIQKETAEKSRMLESIRAGRVEIWTEEERDRRHRKKNPVDSQMNSDLQEMAAQTFSALGHPARIALLQTIQNWNRQGRFPSITELSDRKDISRQAITSHLRILEEAGLLEKKARGRERVYGVRKNGFFRCARFVQSIAGQWGPGGVKGLPESSQEDE